MDSKEPALILRLPEEIISLILTLATLASPKEHERYHKQFLSKTTINLMLTCHRFNRIALPLLYHNISLKFGLPDGNPSPHPVKTLHRIVQQNPDLGRHCRYVMIRIEQRPDLVDIAIVNELFTYLTKVRVLEFRGGYERAERDKIEYLWTLIQTAAQRMDGLEELRCSWLDGILSAFKFVQKVDIRSLKKLFVHICVWPESEDSRNSTIEVGLKWLYSAGRDRRLK